MARTFSHRASRCRGYSFAEVLFAVAVLGIGFIMVAGIFPVAIQQTQAAMDETVGTAATRNGVAYLQGTPFMNSAGLSYTNPTSTPPPPLTNAAAVFSFNDPRIWAGTLRPPSAATNTGQRDLWKSVQNSMIASDDPRYAVVALYSRDEGASLARMFVFGMRIRDREKYDATDLTRVGGAVANLEPRPVEVFLKDGGTTTTDRIWIANLGSDSSYLTAMENLSSASNAEQAAGEGAYVIISDDRVGDDTVNTPYQNEYGKLNGKIYQLGAEIIPANPPPNGQPDYREFELVAGQDMKSDKENIPVLAAYNPSAGNKPAMAFVIGRGYADPTNPGNYSSAVQVVQRYESIISLP